MSAVPGRMKMERKNPQKKRKKMCPCVAVIGAGAAGLMAAVSAAAEGAHVLLFEHTAYIGKKLLLTGSGKCNFTNTEMSEAHYHGDPAFVRQVLSTFSAEDAIAFFRARGILPKVRRYGYDGGGYVYPLSQEAAAVRYALLDECTACGVRFYTGCKIREIKARKEAGEGKQPHTEFVIRTEVEETFSADAVIFATGSNAFPKTGSDSSIYPVLRAFDVPFQAFMPALTSMRCTGKAETEILRAVKGVRCEASVQLMEEEKNGARLLLGACRGEVQFNENSLSGIPIMQLSRYVPPRLKEGKKLVLVLDFLPELGEMEKEAERAAVRGEEKEIEIKEMQENAIEKGKVKERARESFLREQLAAAAKRRAPLGHALCGLLPEKLAREVMLLCVEEASLLERIPQGADRSIAQDAHFLKRLQRSLCAMTFSVSGTGGFETAQCCSGGVDTAAIDPVSMEYKMQKAIYFAGEIMDVDGDCGGYNLHWAWATGRLAGMHAAGFLNP